MLQHPIGLQENDWQSELRNCVRNPQELLRLLDLPEDLLAGARLADREFALKVPHPFLQRMRRGDPDDPLLRQVLPLEAEMLPQPGYGPDPLAEQSHNPLRGVVQKYSGRALLIVSPNCAVNCRYCFRRHFPYQDNNPGRQQWRDVLQFLAEDTGLREVIYSGGDPLICPDRQLQWLTEQVAAIPHVRRLRVHTRLPVVIPQRITRECIDWMAGSHLQTSVVLHINHAQEIDKSLKTAISRLRDAGLTLFNQAVLLRGVNATVEALADLSEVLFECGVIPYYLHLLDKVQGAAHFAVDEQAAKHLHRQLQASLPGYLVPRLAREDAGAPGKTLL